MRRSLIRWGWLFAGPTTLAFMIGFVVPFGLGIYLSFTKFTTVTRSTWVGVDNYVRLIGDQTFLHSLWYTSAFALVTSVIINVAAFAVAYMLVKAIRGSNLFRSVFFMPNLIGGIVLGYTWQTIINAFLVQYQTTLASNAKYGFIGLILLLNWQMIGYMMIIYIAGLQNVPGELIEAASIDGASKWQTLRNVTIPMIMPSITICLFLTLSSSFKLYDANLALTNGAPMRKTEMVALNIVDTFFLRVGVEGVGQAKAMIFFLLVSVVAFFQLRVTRRQEVEQ